jgi:hypothetical protein
MSSFIRIYALSRQERADALELEKDTLKQQTADARDKLNKTQSELDDLKSAVENMVPQVSLSHGVALDVLDGYDTQEYVRYDLDANHAANDICHGSSSNRVHVESSQGSSHHVCVPVRCNCESNTF